MKQIVYIAILLFSINCYSQIPEIVWQQCYGDNGDNYHQSIIGTDSGYLIGVMVTSGENITNYHGGSDIWIQKVDDEYNLIWERCYGGSDADILIKIIKLNDTEFYLFGYSYSTDGDVQSGNNGFSDIWVVKIDGQGNIVWENTYGCTGIDDSRDMIQTPDGGFVMIDRIGIGGGDVTNFYGIGDVWMCKCDSLGNIEWEKSLGNQGLDNGVSLMLNSEGNIMMIGAVQQHGGMVECYPDGAWGDVWIVELDVQGNIISQHCYGGSNYDLGYNIVKTEIGYIIVGGTESNDGDVFGLHGPPGGPPQGHRDIWVVKLNENWEIDWQKCLGGYDSESPEFISKTEDGGFQLIGWTSSNDGDVSGNHSLPGGDETDIWAVKLDSTGEIEWQQCYGGVGSERLMNSHTILKKSDNNYIIAASTNESPSFDVQCGSFFNENAWIFEIKDCSQYMPAVPQTPAGEDTVCSQPASTSVYSVSLAANATDYQWKIFPPSAGSLTPADTSCSVKWNTAYEGTASLVVKSESECGESQWSQPKFVQVFNCIGVEEFESGEIKIKLYPNPAKDFVVFDVESSKFESSVIKIMDVYGNEVDRLKVTNEKTVWQTKDIDSGLYFYRIEVGGKQVTGKVMVVK